MYLFQWPTGLSFPSCFYSSGLYSPQLPRGCSLTQQTYQESLQIASYRYHQVLWVLCAQVVVSEKRSHHTGNHKDQQRWQQVTGGVWNGGLWQWILIVALNPASVARALVCPTNFPFPGLPLEGMLMGTAVASFQDSPQWSLPLDIPLYGPSHIVSGFFWATNRVLERMVYHFQD